jgi:FAD/FMN-containing dehydrogenase
MTRSSRSGAIAALRGHLRGRLVSPEDASYDTARRVWNGRIDRRPALVAYWADGSDVVLAVRFARGHGVPVAVRGGGHSCAGTAVCDDGLVIDLSLMKAIAVDAAARRASAQGGVLWGELDRATQVLSLGSIYA